MSIRCRWNTWCVSRWRSPTGRCSLCTRRWWSRWGSPIRSTWRCWHSGGIRNLTPSPLSVKQIAALLQMGSTTLSPMLKRLQAHGLITLSRSATVERNMQVELSTLAGVLDAELDR
jgi:hypothetical protein